MSLEGTEVTAEGVATLKETLPDCEIQTGQDDRALRIVRRYDQNDDGKLTTEEIPEPHRAELLPAADANGDGAISTEELEAYFD